MQDKTDNSPSKDNQRNGAPVFATDKTELRADERKGNVGRSPKSQSLADVGVDAVYR